MVTGGTHSRISSQWSSFSALGLSPWDPQIISHLIIYSFLVLEMECPLIFTVRGFKLLLLMCFVLQRLPESSFSGVVFWPLLMLCVP